MEVHQEISRGGSVERCVRACPSTSGPPPCLALCCWPLCEANKPCAKLGACGIKDITPQRRKQLMYVAALITILGIIFSTVAIFSLDPSFSMVESCCWTKGTIINTVNMTSTKVFVGLRSVAIRTETYDDDSLSRVKTINEHVISWNTEICEQELSTEICTSCRDAVLSTGTPAIMAIVTALPQLATDLLRSLEDQDVRCQKAFGIITGVFGLLSTLVSLNTFGLSCRRSLDTLPGQTWEVGPGLALATSAVVLKVVDIGIHCIVPVPEIPTAHETLHPSKKGGSKTKQPQQTQEFSTEVVAGSMQ